MTRKELEKMTIAALRAMAKARSTKLRPTLKKKEIIDLLLLSFQNHEEPRPERLSRKAPAAAPQTKRRTEPKLKGHAGEGEAHDEKVILNPSPVFEKSPDSPYAEIPREYRENRIVLLVRDPEWVYAYWEVTPDAMGEANRRLADSEARLTLRVYDITEMKDLTYFWDIEVYQRIGNWYIDVGRPDRTYLVDVGMKSGSGGFATIARSNAGHTPPNAPSSRFDEEWWTVEWDREVIVSPFDEGRRLPLEPIEKEMEAGSAHLLPLSLLRREET
ncbi:MAG TPA: DUF4912 domain-containing protein [Candidatus Manganitrophaceae bacterium]|nr:DUF4912 domain-containing protein [Candidatus Manganitrophaceae bacterium]